MISIYLIKYTDLGQAKESILSRYSQVKGETYTIEYLPSGQPQLMADSVRKGCVSISHTDNLLAMAFCDDIVGIDVERADRQVSSKVCKNIEDWTKIEAYAKWTGRGLSKDVISGQIPQDMITTTTWGQYVISVCSHCQNVEIIYLG